MEKLPELKHHRRSMRLPCWDYSEGGYYFVTICTEKRKCILREIKEGKMVLSDKGIMVNDWINKIKDKFKSVDLDIYQIMPNHVHLIIIISDVNCTDVSSSVGAGYDAHPDNRGEHQSSPLPKPSLSEIIQWFKTRTTDDYIQKVKENIWPPFDKRVWQRNYYEHIIRNNRELAILREYIENNPLEWEIDEENPKNIVI